MHLTAYGKALPGAGLFRSKNLLVMKLTAILVVAACLEAGAKGYSQPITLSMKDAPLQKVLSAIEKQSGVNFIYGKDLISHAAPVSIDVSAVTLIAALDMVFKNQPIEYKISDNYIVLSPKPPQLSRAQSTFKGSDIHGRVTDSTGAPLAGASVTVKGTRKGTSTDANGNYELKNVEENATLVISFTGYIAQEIKLNGKNTIDVALFHSTSQLDQVQVIAYGTTTARLNTGNVTTITSEEIGNQPVANPLLALEGRVPGMDIVQQTGFPNGGVSVQIRGLNSIAAGTAPLYIVDGIPYSTTSSSTSLLGYGLTSNADLLNPLNFLNPLDIESIDILKDADATGIYGSRGANGVVLITTKKGKSGKTKIDVNLSTGTSQVGHFMNLLNTKQYLAMRREAFANDSLVPTINSAPDLFSWDTTKYTNWQKQFIGGTAHNANAQISISGGNKNTQFLISGNYLKVGTVFPGDFSDKRGSANISFNNISDNQKFKSVISVNYLNENNNQPLYDPTPATTISPNVPNLIDSNGNLLWPAHVRDNPYADIRNSYILTSNNLISHGSLSYQILPTLEILTDLGFSRTALAEITTFPIEANNPIYGVTTGSSNFANNSVQTWNIEPQLNWIKHIGFSKIGILIGTTFLQTLESGSVINATGYTNDDLLKDINSAGQLTSGGTSYSLYRYNSFFGRANYNFNDKYLINLTGRRDGSSRFGPGNQFANFGAIGAAWIFSNETFLKENLSFLSFGKIRGSYGTTGNDQIPDYGYQQLFGSTGYSFQNSTTFYPINLANPTFGWEKDKKLEIGVNLGFMNDRILFAADWYQNRSGNQLVNYALPPSVGLSFIQGNLPALVQNTGVEISLNTINVGNSIFKWTSSFNISIPRNKLISYPNIKSSPYEYTYAVGKSLYIQQRFHSLGVDPTTGIYKYQDIDGSGTGLDYPGDLQPLKQIAKNFYGGLQNSLSIYGFQLDFLFQFVKQTGNNALFTTSNTQPGGESNQLTEVLSRWQKPGDNTNVQKFTTGGGAGFPAYLAFAYGRSLGDNEIGDASFIRLKNIALSYRLPQKIIQKAKLQQARIFIQAQNLFTLTSFKGLDPESNGVFALPPLKTINAGFQLTF